MNKSETFYVYVYIDPRNYEEFYYGKGKGNRKSEHLSDAKDSEKVKRIKSIQKAGLNPIIKVIARNLSENEALLIETTLIWKLGKSLTNIASGHFIDKFRPANYLHLNLPGFDFQNGIYYVNVGQGKHRCWDDCRVYGFISAGQDKKYSDPLRTLNEGDIVVAYLKKHGFVGIGKVVNPAVRINEFKINGKLLNQYPLIRLEGMFHNNDNEKSEYLVRINWMKSCESKDAKWKPKFGLFTTQQVKASLHNQLQTMNFLEKEFDINFTEIALQE